MKKSQYIVEQKVAVLVMGYDRLGKFDSLSHFCEVMYLPRTPSISMIATIEKGSG